MDDDIIKQQDELFVTKSSFIFISLMCFRRKKRPKDRTPRSPYEITDYDNYKIRALSPYESEKGEFWPYGRQEEHTDSTPQKDQYGFPVKKDSHEGGF